MSQPRLGIMENGNVYRLNGGRRRLLGTLGGLLGERTATGDEVRTWWEQQMATEGPLVTLDGGE